jgi:hypothetical protein
MNRAQEAVSSLTSLRKAAPAFFSVTTEYGPFLV